MIHHIFCCLDYLMDGQLGHGEANSPVPCLIEHFPELGSPHSLAGESNTYGEQTPLKVVEYHPLRCK